MSLRNVALVAHVDHGKTTLVDGLLRATGVFAAHQALVDRVMDSNDQERERGITILAKAASVMWRGVKINLVDTPGHADFGGEVERALALVDGVLLLVDAAEGPLPQTRYVLSKALARDLPAVVVLNKLDRADARPAEVLDEIEQLFIDLASHPEQLSFPVISAVSREGRAVVGVGLPSEDADLAPVLDAVLEHIPAPDGDPDAPLQALVTNLDASDYLGRLAVGRVVQGTLRSGEPIALLTEEYEVGEAPIVRRPSQVLAFTGIARADAEVLKAGDLFVIAGYPEVEIGDTFAAPSDPKPLPRLIVDEPVLAMTFSVNTSPLAGRSGKFVTSRHLRERLEREVRGNVSIRLEDTDSPDALEVAGRGELQLAVLIESMRREGYELQVSRPEVITREVDGRRHEPLERGTCDVPDEHVGTVTQALAPRKGVDHRAAPGRRRPDHHHLRGAGPGPDRVPLAAAHRHPRHGAAPPAPRRLDPVGRRAAAPHRRGDDRRPHGRRDRLRARQPPAARAAVRRPRRHLLRGHGHRRGQPVRRHGRQRGAGQGEDQHPHPQPRRGREAGHAHRAHAGVGHRVDRRGRAGRGHARRHPHPQAAAGRGRPPPGRQAGLTPGSRTTLAGCGEASRWGRRWWCCSPRAAARAAVEWIDRVHEPQRGSPTTAAAPVPAVAPSVASGATATTSVGGVGAAPDDTLSAEVDRPARRR